MDAVVTSIDAGYRSLSKVRAVPHVSQNLRSTPGEELNARGVPLKSWNSCRAKVSQATDGAPQALRQVLQ